MIKETIRTLLFRRASTASVPQQAKHQEWSIGIYFSTSPCGCMSGNGVPNPVLTREDVVDRQADFVADPFMVSVDGQWYMFFEVVSLRTKKGEIGLATSRDGVSWSYQQIVLTEPFHLSYPYVFKWRDDHYMIPETYQTGSIRLYKALIFPTQWSWVGTLVKGPYLVDASIFRYEDKWWLFTEANPVLKHDTLRLFFSEDLLGPWIEHPKSPIIEGSPHIARPAGRVLALNDRIIRYAQNCFPVYGTEVRAFEIAELTTKSYSEREVQESPILRPSGTGWNADGMHHIDPHRLDDGRWVACVDGRREVKGPKQ